MHRFFSECIPEPGETGRLDPEESRHAYRVLRIRGGEIVEIINGTGGRASARVLEVPGAPRRPLVEYEVQNLERCRRPSPLIHLCVAPPRAKAMAQIVQQATELGARSISPVLCEFGVAKPAKNSSLAHWRQEAISAMKQSGNPWYPTLNESTAFSQCLQSNGQTNAVFGHCSASSPPTLPRLEEAEELIVWVGPEAGFSESEQQQLLETGARPVQLGPYILRVETAVVALLGWINGVAPHNPRTPPSPPKPEIHRDALSNLPKESCDSAH
ncbi:MAG: RsmE family RNA methyltransferase [Verrucomicrobiota bacterium]